MNDRIKELRKKHLKLTQDEFSQKINISRSNLANIETKKVNITDRLIKDICSTFNVNEHWLRTGEGEMFVENDESIIADLATKYHLDELDKKIIEHYLKLDSRDRQSIKNYVLSLTSMINESELAATTKDDIELAATVEDDIESELARYREELEAEKKGQMLLALQKRETS